MKAEGRRIGSWEGNAGAEVKLKSEAALSIWFGWSVRLLLSAALQPSPLVPGSVLPQ